MPRSFLRNHCKRIYFLACQGDPRALADIRAYVDTLRKNRNRKRWRMKLAKTKRKIMKTPLKLLASLALTSTILLSGCAGRMTPQGAAGLTTAAVYAFGNNNPKIVKTMRDIQPAVCEIAKNPGATVEDVIGVIQNTGGVDADTKAIINVLLAIYQTSIYPSHTNQAESHPYLEAIICPGWAGGLALLPGEVAGIGDAPARGWNSRQEAKWILVK